MAQIRDARTLPQTQKYFREGFKDILRPASERIVSLLVRNGGADGVINPRLESALIRSAGEIVQSVFTGLDGRSVYAANEVAPLSPYASLINRAVIRVTVKGVRAHRNWLRQNIPDDVFRWLAGARRPESVREMVLPAMSKVFGEYDPLHLWVDPNGYRLSDRIWRAGVDTRTRIDAILAEGIRSGESAISLSKKLERFLLPGRAALRTQKPYGTDASYRGMVLGRTEITRAHGQTTLIAARLNPYVTGLDWALSASHPKMDICDSLATIGMGGGRIKEPYGLYDAINFPPHPQCLCSIYSAVTSTPAQVTAELRAMMEAGDEPPVTPAADGILLWLLLGAELYRWFQSNQDVVEAA